MIRARFGRVINIASIVGIKANPGQSNYAAAKAGLIAMTHTVAAEVSRRGVTVNAVAPGFIQTDMTEELTEDWLKLIPARRLGTPEDGAAAESGIREGEGACVDFDPTDTMTPKEARRADRFTQLGLAASDHALAEAGWDQGLPYDPDRVGVIIGTGIGGLATIEEQHGVLA